MPNTVRRRNANGSPDVIGRGLTKVSDDSFESRIGKRITPRPDGCWQWDDGTAHYPTVYPGGPGTGLSAHRWIYFVLKRLNPEDWSDHLVHHECQNKNCVNPDHMLLLTPSEHQLRHGELRQAG